MSWIRDDYILYKKFLKVYRPYYNIFFLADLMHWIKEESQAFISAQEIRERWERHVRLIKNNKISNTLNFYIHIPFCRSKCTYCMYYSKPVVKEELERYLNKLIKQMHYFRKTFAGIEFSSLYIGGGTPSILSEEQINKFFGNLFNTFKFKKDGQKNFECNPESTTFKKLKLLKKFGFNRVSFGVQNLDRKVLFYANRHYQNYRHIQEVVEYAKTLGFEVNTDLMINIRGDNIKSIVQSFVKLTKIRPDSIDLYPFKPSEVYLKKYLNNDYYSFCIRLHKKAKRVRQILKSIAETQGYSIFERSFEIYTSAEPKFFSKEFRRLYNYRYDFTSPINYPKPCSLFALGTQGSSYIFNSLQYHEIAAKGKEEANFKPQEKNYWTMRLNLKDEMRYFILQQLSCRLCFSQREFKRFFNADFKANFKEAINSLKKLGKLKFNNDLVFLPSGPLERFTCALFFFERKEVLKKINNFCTKDSKINFTKVNG